MNVCTDCAVNSVSRTEAASYCEPCPSGTVSNSDKTDCGEFFKSVGNFCLCALLFPSVSSAFFNFLLQFINYHSDSCPAGKYRDDTMNTCEPCPAGTVPNVDQSECG